MLRWMAVDVQAPKGVRASRFHDFIDVVDDVSDYKE
jgi:hypothetical protein